MQRKQSGNGWVVLDNQHSHVSPSSGRHRLDRPGQFGHGVQRLQHRPELDVGHGVEHAAFEPVDVSNDGRYVVFASSASNLVPNDDNGRADLFRKDMQTGATLYAGGRVDPKAIVESEAIFAEIVQYVTEANRSAAAE